MTRDEIINSLEREVKSIRREPQSKMLGICITVDEAEDILAMLEEQEDLKQKMCNALYAVEIAIKAIAEQDGR